MLKLPRRNIAPTVSFDISRGDAASTTGRQSVWPRLTRMAGLDVTPGVPSGSQIVQAYGEGRFRIGGVVHEGSVIVWPLATRPWPVRAPSDIVADQLISLLDGGAGIEILVIGCGKRFAAPPPGLRSLLRDSGIGVEWMDTGAACRTYNVLVIEGRPVAAALIAVD